MSQLEARSIRMQIACRVEYQLRLEVQHAPRATAIVLRHAIVHLTRADHDHVARTSLHRPAPAGRAMPSAHDHTHAELVVGMAGERYRGGRSGGPPPPHGRPPA